MRKTVERMGLITWQKIIQVDGSPDQPGKLQWKPSQPHAASCRSTIFPLYVVLKLKIIKEKLMSLNEKKIFLLFLEQKTTKKITLNK